MRAFLCLVGLLLAGSVRAQQPAPLLTASGDTLPGEWYGSGTRGVVIIAHGGYSSLASWAETARAVAAAGFRVLVFETRAAVELRRGRETDCLYDAACMARDVLVAVRRMRVEATGPVAVIGGSAGGGAVEQASIDATADEIDRLVLLAPMTIAHPEQTRGSKLFITSLDDRNDAGPRLPGIQSQYEKSNPPKRMVVLPGDAHGQMMLGSSEGPRVLREILRFLSAQP